MSIYFFYIILFLPNPAVLSQRPAQELALPPLEELAAPVGPPHDPIYIYIYTI